MFKGNTTRLFGTPTTTTPRPNIPNRALQIPMPEWAEVREDSTDETWDATSGGSTFTAAKYTIAPRLDPGSRISVEAMQSFNRGGEPLSEPIVFAFMDAATLEPGEARDIAAALLRAADVADQARA